MPMLVPFGIATAYVYSKIADESSRTNIETSCFGEIYEASPTLALSIAVKTKISSKYTSNALYDVDSYVTISKVNVVLNPSSLATAAYAGSVTSEPNFAGLTLASPRPSNVGVFSAPETL